MSDSQRILVVPDIHIPYQDDKALNVLEKFMADHHWDEVVYLGDLLDFDMISSFNAENLRENETRRIIQDYSKANEILDRHQKIVRKKNKHARFTLLEGNHENRIQRLIDHTPHLEGLLEVDKNLRLKDRGFKWVASWTDGELHTIGNLSFGHGLYLNKYHAAKMVDVFGTNIVYGHTHDVTSFTKTTLGKNKIIVAQSLGFLADEAKLKYMKQGPSNWIQAFGVAEIRPNGNFNIYPVVIINHEFSWNGKVYR